MQQHRERVHDAGVHTREELEARYGPVSDVRDFARNFILVGIDGHRVVVRRKGGDSAVGVLRYQPRPLLFYQFESLSDGNAQSAR